MFFISQNIITFASSHTTHEKIWSKEYHNLFYFVLIVSVTVYFRMQRVQRTKVNIIKFLLLLKFVVFFVIVHCRVWAFRPRKHIYMYCILCTFFGIIVNFISTSRWQWLHWKSGLVVYFNHSSFLEINQTLGNNFENIFHSKRIYTHLLHWLTRSSWNSRWMEGGDFLHRNKRMRICFLPFSSYRNYDNAF